MPCFPIRVRDTSQRVFSTDMNESVVSRFFCSEEIFICPICKKPLFLKEKSLVCENNHCFDISKKGYVNLAPSAKKSDNYDKESFIHRRTVLEGGFYDHILSGLKERTPYGITIDAGCGEGFYSKNIPAKKMLAFDISKESVALASKSFKDAVFFAADLANIPLKDGIADCVLNIFSPANYAEFKRVLKKDGVLVKAVPGENHLKEIRELVKDELETEEYSNERLIEHCRKYCDIKDISVFSKTYPLADDKRAAFLAMTPLMFGKREKTDFLSLKEITVSAVLITAHMR